MNQLQDKIAIVTGAASGIGKAIAERFAQEGARVMLSDLHAAPLEAATQRLLEQGYLVHALTADIAREEEVNRLIDETVAHWGGLDMLVNNAGIMDDFTPAADVSNTLWDTVLAVNLSGPFYACRKAIPVFLQQEKGVIINVASIGGLYGGRAGAAYTASKHGLIGLTKNIGYQYAPRGIRCNAIAPGGVTTNIMEHAHIHPAGFERMNAGTANNIRAAEPAEIAQLALFLASDEASFLNGTTVTADGGWTAY
ncbi:SDR family oxidoreductase [Rhabdobacter roseus]|uniref:NAD(P)-dependent dehydrogenase (Short-subunit alcohol dehydrogenase family) n=1 Tax=Rhabdobacter roseus TaxID=1655419 RepID=A0A840TP94_9BACT|nr:glucose 1-dehydrogenase [Rhabdobacter roseus]MBB5283043.1 NAD(P)-dependent dehydrogenase (short-subunit alcohol dehydrogenase family) [Rhabdobacter roseus]